MQVTAVHGIGEIVERQAVVGVPDRGAEETGPVGMGELFRHLEFGWFDFRFTCDESKTRAPATSMVL